MTGRNGMTRAIDGGTMAHGCLLRRAAHEPAAKRLAGPDGGLKKP
jgi:hypothetical protein